MTTLDDVAAAVDYAFLDERYMALFIHTLIDSLEAKGHSSAAAKVPRLFDRPVKVEELCAYDRGFSDGYESGRQAGYEDDCDDPWGMS